MKLFENFCSNSSKSLKFDFSLSHDFPQTLGNFFQSQYEWKLWNHRWPGTLLSNFAGFSPTKFPRQTICQNLSVPTRFSLVESFSKERKNFPFFFKEIQWRIFKKSIVATTQPFLHRKKSFFFFALWIFSMSD